MKKYLLMLMAALVAITTSFTLVSCGDDDDDQYKEGYFTLKAEAKLEGFSAAEMEEILGQPTSETATNYMSEIQAKTYAESIGIKIRNLFLSVYDMFKDGQKVTYTVSLYRGKSASGTPIFVKKFEVTKSGIKDL